MHRSGITVSRELASAFNEASSSPSTGLMKIKIDVDAEAFVAEQTGQSFDQLGAAFDAARALLEDNVPAYVLIKDNTGDKMKWIFVAYVPPSAIVKQKMLYASSRSSLKDGLGSGGVIATELFISEKGECNVEEYERSRAVVDRDELLTQNEFIKKQAHHDSVASAKSVKVAAIADIPIKVAETATADLNKFASGDVACVFLTLDVETEVLNSETDAKIEADDIDQKLSPNEPNFILYRFVHKNREGQDATKTLFVYYCPDNSKPRHKMFYSSTKSMVLKVLEKLNIDVHCKIEASETNEVKADNFIYELYPAVVEKNTFAKPKRPGQRGNKRRFKKFSADN
eukprot:TRINITY_DN66170_c14_g1_i1.p2 TRINITY_DN66170_c14_g1~~TRINITY_DN66170_c14_g1_i1.p2  ORF type:complete len:342 (-),score=194.20 TRINITY_DN66170_c14_g1_i1:61-1086(-)